MTKRDKMLLVVLAVVIGVASIVFLVFMPTTNRIASLRAQINSVDNQIAAAQRDFQAYQNLQVQVAELREHLLVAEAAEGIYVPYDFDVLESMRLIQRVLYPHTTRIGLSFAAPRVIYGTNGTYIRSLDLTFESDFHDVLDVLYNLLEGGPPHRIVNYSIQHQLPGQGYGEWLFDEEYEMYFFIEQELGRLTMRMRIEFLTRLSQEEEDQ